jgi:hypothetical protein
MSLSRNQITICKIVSKGIIFSTWWAEGKGSSTNKLATKEGDVPAVWLDLTQGPTHFVQKTNLSQFPYLWSADNIYLIESCDSQSIYIRALPLHLEQRIYSTNLLSFLQDHGFFGYFFISFLFQPQNNDHQRDRTQEKRRHLKGSQLPQLFRAILFCPASLKS